MSKNDAWMPLYVGDYLADTMHLTGPEHGAYLLLLMHSWRTGPLPDDDTRLAAIARTDAAAWRRMSSTIRAFFILDDGALVQGRLERIRNEQGNKIEQRRAAGKASAEARKAQRESNDRSTTVDAPLQQKGRELELELELEEKNPPTPRKRGIVRSKPGLSPAQIEDAFTSFWVNYPRSDGRKKALEAFENALAKTGWDPQPILDGLLMRLDRFDTREEGRFVPHASTWLNQERWRDGDSSPLSLPHAPNLPLN